MLHIDCHVHTLRHSPCSRLEPQRAVALARERGLDVLVITEHWRRWGAAELEPLRAQAPGLTILSGMEVTLSEGVDVVLLGEPVPAQLTPPFSHADLCRLLEPLRAEFFAFAVHLFRNLDTFSPAVFDILQSMDGLEMNSVNILKAGWRRDADVFAPRRRELYAAAREFAKLRPMYCSDAHDEIALAAISMALDTPPLASAAELVAALRSCVVSQRQNTALLPGALANRLWNSGLCT